MSFFAKFIVVVTFLFNTKNSIAQDSTAKKEHPFSEEIYIETITGDSTILKNETVVNIEFTYNNMSVGRYNKEADYIKFKTEDMNKGIPGSGDKWAKKWVLDRERRYQPKFINAFTGANGVQINKEAKYPLIFNTDWIEYGWDEGVWGPGINGFARMDAAISIVETSKSENKRNQNIIHNSLNHFSVIPV